MKQIIILCFAFFTAVSAYCQNYLQDGDRCFDNGDYACAITKYNEAFKSASGKDKQIAEIKLTRAKWCAEHIITANQAFAAKNYSNAKVEYQKVLDSNTKDIYAQSQIVKCDNALNPPKLRKATTAELTDIWNNKYGVQPQRRQNLINVGIDPDDAQTRINAGEGKPQEKEKQATNLSVSKSTLYFTSYGETSETIKVYSDASTYSVPSGYVPSWCTVKTYSGYFTVTASANPNNTSRTDWFKVTAGGKEVKINVEQSARTSPNSQQSSSPKKQTSQSNAKKCFNCPKGRKHTVGLSFGYANKPLINNDYSYILLGLSGGSLGFRIEPLFKYGFGLNTGIFYEFYPEQYNDGNSKMALNIPLNLEYRFNFHQNFNMFFYGGASVDYTINAFADFNFSGYIEPISYIGYFDKNRFVPYLEYGGGIRIKKVQFNACIHYFVDIQNDFTIYNPINYTISCSLMF